MVFKESCGTNALTRFCSPTPHRFLFFFVSVSFWTTPSGAQSLLLILHSNITLGWTLGTICGARD